MCEKSYEQLGYCILLDRIQTILIEVQGFLRKLALRFSNPSLETDVGDFCRFLSFPNFHILKSLHSKEKFRGCGISPLSNGEHPPDSFP
jgi:hypothetical protein